MDADGLRIGVHIRKLLSLVFVVIRRVVLRLRESAQSTFLREARQFVKRRIDFWPAHVLLDRFFDGTTVLRRKPV